MNELLFILYSFFILTGSVFFLKKGLIWITSWLSILIILMNFFVNKQISLFSLNITAADPLSVGYLFGLNLIREFYSSKEAKNIAKITLIISMFLPLICFMHLSLIPNSFDYTQIHFSKIIAPSYRIIAASILTFFIVQFIDLKIFSLLKQLLKRRFFVSRSLVVLIISQFIDTVLFSFLALYGQVSNIFHIILMSLFAKIFASLISIPVTLYLKKMSLHQIQKNSS